MKDTCEAVLIRTVYATDIKSDHTNGLHLIPFYAATKSYGSYLQCRLRTFQTNSMNEHLKCDIRALFGKLLLPE